MATRKANSPEERDARFFLILIALLLMLIAGSLIFYIEYYQLQGIWKDVQTGLINIFTSVVGFTGALTLMSRYNERRQRHLISESVSEQILETQNVIRSAENCINNEIRRLRVAVVSASAWKEKYNLLRDVDYGELFSGAQSVGLVVHSWDRWVDERRKNIIELTKRGGRFTLVVLEPEDDILVTASKSRWKMREMDQKRQIYNTINMLEKLVPKEQLKIVRRKETIWHCVIRFEYVDPDDTVYIISPFSHEDFPVNNIPVFVVRKSLLPDIAEFFDQDWRALSGAG